MTDVNGQVESSCDCQKGKTVASSCIHRQLVDTHFPQFGDALTNGEEPESFFICRENGVLVFSVALNSGSSRHHTPKRRIVRKNEYWKCTSCMKDRFSTFIICAVSSGTADTFVLL